jgi:hypothetical protein
LIVTVVRERVRSHSIPRSVNIVFIVAFKAKESLPAASILDCAIRADAREAASHQFVVLVVIGRLKISRLAVIFIVRICEEKDVAVRVM